MNPNTIGAERRWHLDCARSVRLRQGKIYPERSEGRSAASEERGVGKGRHVLSPPQHTEDPER